MSTGIARNQYWTTRLTYFSMSGMYHLEFYNGSSTCYQWSNIKWDESLEFLKQLCFTHGYPIADNPIIYNT